MTPLAAVRRLQGELRGLINLLLADPRVKIDLARPGTRHPPDMAADLANIQASIDAGVIPTLAESHRTPLHCALINGHAEAVNLLPTQPGLDSNHKDNMGPHGAHILFDNWTGLSDPCLASR